MKSSNKGEKILVDNQTHILVDTMFCIALMNISESQVVLFNSDTITASANKITLKRTGTAMATTEELQKWAKLANSHAYSESVALSAPISEEKMNQLVYKNTLGNDNFETLLAKMNPLMGKIEGREDSFTLKFRALAYLFPKECVKMGDVLKKTPLESPMFKIMSNALASTETPQAINTLVAVIEARQQDEAVVLELLQILTYL